MGNIYFYPPESRNVLGTNSYSENFRNSLLKNHNSIIRSNFASKLPGLNFLINSFRANSYIINWLENISFRSFGTIQAILSLLGLFVISIRKKKIIWMFHNIHPHQGESFWSLKIKDVLFKKSSTIIAHSIEAKQYAQKFAKGTVIYRCHPLDKFIGKTGRTETFSKFDFLLWGGIYDHKGILEFLQMTETQNSNANIFVVGQCKNEVLAKGISSLCNEHIHFENRIASFEELTKLCAESRYILFTYIGDSISSSGVLMDTIRMGGTAIGPNRGAFADICEEGCCYTYNNILDVFEMLNEGKPSISSDKLKHYCINNSWDRFAKSINELLS